MPHLSLEYCRNTDFFFLMWPPEPQPNQQLPLGSFSAQSKSSTDACYLSPFPFNICYPGCNFTKTGPLIIHCPKYPLLWNESHATDREAVGPARFWSFHYVHRPQEQLLTNLSVVLYEKEPGCAPAVFSVRESNLHFDRLCGQKKR